MKNLCIYLSVSLMLLACSKDVEDCVKAPSLDLSIVSGKYVGTWEWEFGTGPISMIIKPIGQQNRYAVEFYETERFVPMFNSDGITPEARGFLNIDGIDAIIELNLSTDQPSCAGNYDGTGMRTQNGVLELTMDIMHNCAEDAEASWGLRKIEEL